MNVVLAWLFGIKPPNDFDGYGSLLDNAFVSSFGMCTAARGNNKENTVCP